MKQSEKYLESKEIKLKTSDGFIPTGTVTLEHAKIHGKIVEIERDLQHLNAEYAFEDTYNEAFLIKKERLESEIAKLMKL